MTNTAQLALAKFNSLIGKEEGTGDWHLVDQAQINNFADATLDHQFIHIDPDKSLKVSPYKCTIAHGFLTLSMLVHLSESIPSMVPAAYEGLLMGINYGLDRVRFPNAVKVDSKIRARRTLISVESKNQNTLQLKRLVTIDIDGEEKPGCVAETLTRLIYSI